MFACRYNHGGDSFTHPHCIVLHHRSKSGSRRTALAIIEYASRDSGLNKNTKFGCSFGPRHHVVDSPISCSCRSAYSRVKQHIHSRVVTFVQKAGPNSAHARRLFGICLIFNFDRIDQWVSFRASITPTYKN